jgi:hypothetical protein
LIVSRQIVVGKLGVRRGEEGGRLVKTTKVSNDGITFTRNTKLSGMFF